jgi:hypothetical protein
MAVGASGYDGFLDRRWIDRGDVQWQLDATSTPTVTGTAGVTAAELGMQSAAMQAGHPAGSTNGKIVFAGDEEVLRNGPRKLKRSRNYQVVIPRSH